MANIYSVIVLTSGLIGLFLQCLGLVTWGWLQINSSTWVSTPTENQTTEERVKSSLWRIEICTHVLSGSVDNRTCVTIPKSELGETIGQIENQPGPVGQKPDPAQQQAAVNALFGDFDVLPYLVVAALICSGFGLVVFTFQYCSCCAKAKSRVEIVSLLFWLIAVSLLAAAVGIGGHLNSFLSSIYTMVSNLHFKLPDGYQTSIKASVKFPWSILFSGMGMLFCFINIVAITIDICVTKFKRSTDYWKYGRVHLSDDHQKVELLNDSEE